MKGYFELGTCTTVDYNAPDYTSSVYALASGAAPQTGGVASSPASASATPTGSGPVSTGASISGSDGANGSDGSAASGSDGSAASASTASASDVAATTSAKSGGSVVIPALAQAQMAVLGGAIGLVAFLL